MTGRPDYSGAAFLRGAVRDAKAARPRKPYPTASTVSRALNRDAGIRTTPTGRRGWHVRGDGTYPASISVDLSGLPLDAPNEDVRGARDLFDHLAALGWKLQPLEDRSTIVYVLSVPTAAERRATD